MSYCRPNQRRVKYEGNAKIPHLSHLAFLCFTICDVLAYDYCNTESHKLHLLRGVCGFFMPVGLYLQTVNRLMDY
jgi:hypothetical protein